MKAEYILSDKFFLVIFKKRKDSREKESSHLSSLLPLSYSPQNFIFWNFMDNERVKSFLSFMLLPVFFLEGIWKI